MNKIFFCRITVCVLLLVSISSPASSQTKNNYWRDAAEKYSLKATERSSIPDKYRSLRLDLPALISILNGAVNEDLPNAFSSGPVILLPMPDGSFSRFRIALSSLMPKQLADNFPMIRTFTGTGIDDTAAVAKIDYTYWGFHAMIMSPKGWIFIDPVSLGNTSEYISYDKKYSRRTGLFVCETEKIPGSPFEGEPTTGVYFRSAGSQLKTYRLAVACTGEYAATYGGTAVGAMSGIVTSVNRVTGVYELELAVRLVLIANDNLLVYTNPATDPYTNGNGSTMLSENQTNITNVIGSANYDIGHVFSTGGGGIAGLGVVCSSGNKANGVTGQAAPVGDAFDIDYVAHEMGHQFGGNHTFNSVTGKCSGNRASTAAYEPGSGTTIMAYAGICLADDIQPHSDAIFHTKSFDEIQTYITSPQTGSTCPVVTNTGNTPPVVTVGSNYTIPFQTPFILTGSATDINNDPVTYLWEEYDLGPSGAPNSPSGNAPIFRDFVPVSSPSRTFPRIEDLVRNTQTIGEILPSYARSLVFRFTARDNRAGGGGVTHNDTPVTLTVTNTTTPFKVTIPNTAVNWFANSTQTITWDVSSTNLSPISCANVNILLSIDSGYTYPYTLLTSTTNDGSEAVTLPNVITTKARIKVESVGNVFFDMSDVNFSISSSSAILTVISTTTLSSNNLCAGSILNVNFATDGPANAGNVFTAQLSNSAGSFTSPVDIGTLSGINAGTINAVIPGGTVTGTGYRIRVVSSNPVVTGSDNGANISIFQSVGTAGTITGLSTVCQGQTGVSYSLSAITNATGYIWTLPSGASITAGANTNSITVTFTSGAASGSLTVQGTNSGCGTGTVSTPKSVSVSNLPVAAGVITGTTIVCQGQSGVAYSVPAISGATGYNWVLPSGGTIASGANTNSITVNFSVVASSGIITVGGTNTCGTGTTSPFSVSLMPVPTAPVISAGGPTTFCTGSNVALSYTQSGGTAYQWRKDGVDISGGTGALYSALTTGIYDVIAGSAQTFTNPNVVSIPDFVTGSCQVGTSTIGVSGYTAAVTSSGINIKINITHTYVGDLVIVLQAPNSSILGLSNSTGSASNSGDNFTNTIFSDAGATVIPTLGAPYTGTYKPVASVFSISTCVTTTLTSFAAIGGGSINPNGNWILKVYDRGAADVGTIDNWSITFPASTHGPCYSTSNQVPVTVNATTTPGVSISANPGNTICSGTSVIFTATPTNGGTPSYQWKVNGTNAGTNSAAFTTSTLTNGQVVTCVMSSNAACASPATATSTGITMTVNPVVTPSVSIGITSGANPSCVGSSVTFTATPTNGGTPTYQWKVDGTNSGTNSSAYSTTILTDGQVISCEMMSGETCVAANPVTSNSTSMTVVSQPVINTFTPAFGIQGTSVIVSGSGFTGTTDVKFNGVNSVFTVDNANQITATVPAGATTGLISVTGTCGTANSSQNFNVTGYATLNLKVLIEGFYQGIGLMRNVSSLTSCDTIEVCLAAATYPFSIVYSVRGPIQPSGNGSFNFPSAALGQSFYIVVKHRNSLQTWSSLPVSLSTAVSTYDFTTGVSQAFGDNLVDQGSKYAIISGDVNQDGRIDIFDFTLIENAADLFQYGYIPEDITGDGLIESGDFSLVENNLSKTIKKP